MALQFLASDDTLDRIGRHELGMLATAYGRMVRHPDPQVELDLLDADDMRALNREQRQIDEPTDVLSFPTYASLAEMGSTPVDMPLLIGSIVICPAKAAAYEETLPQLVHHGLLHLMGHDHETDEAGWRAAEAPVLAELAAGGLSIPGIPL